MKVLSVKLRDWFGNELTHLEVIPMGDRYYQLPKNVEVIVTTDDGDYRYNFCGGFETNFRSGGKFVDCFIDQIGDKLETQLSWLVHDANYTPCASLGMKHPLGRTKSDKLLRAMLKYAGMSTCKVNAVYSSVRLFGGCAYHEDDRLTKMNSELFSFARMGE